MIKKIMFTALLLLLCSSCVSRTIYMTKGLSEDEKKVTIGKKKLIWFWNDEYNNP